MNEEEKKKYEELKSLLYTGTISQYGKRKLIDLIETQQKELEEKTEIIESFIHQRNIDIEALDKKDKIIELMAEDLAGGFCEEEHEINKKQIRERYIRKVEEEK